MLVVANETVVGEPLLREDPRAGQRGAGAFLIISPQSDVRARRIPRPSGACAVR